MPLPRQSRSRDIAIRLAGLVMLPIGAVSINGLCHLVHVVPAHESSFPELALAALGFLCLSIGSALLSLGAHLFDEVEISARWARRPGAAPQRMWVSPDELISRPRPQTGSGKTAAGAGNSN